MTTLPDITLFRGSPPQNAYVWSPFVTKLEARLRFDTVRYRLAAGSPKSAPKGKIPYISVASATNDNSSPETMGDSALIIRSLVANGMLTDANATLSAAERARDLALRALLEDRLYFYGTREKWCDNYLSMRAGVLAAVPWPLQTLVGWLAYRGVAAGLQGQGTGRLNDDEVLAFKEEAWESVDALLSEAKAAAAVRTGADEPFWVLGGEEPTEADSTLFGFVVGALVCDAAPVTAKIVKGYPTLIEYARRIHDRYFPDYQRWDQN